MRGGRSLDIAGIFTKSRDKMTWNPHLMCTGVGRMRGFHWTRLDGHASFQGGPEEMEVRSWGGGGGYYELRGSQDTQGSFGKRGSSENLSEVRKHPEQSRRS